MIRQASSLIFVHGGREAYPEIAAYREAFGDAYAITECRPEALSVQPGLSHAVVWMIMGFYPRRRRAALVVHDYRSLSVGRLHRVKDGLKRVLNAVPDARIFQNSVLRDAMGFNDGVPTFLLPMGVPSRILEHRKTMPPARTCDFCYIGALSAERRTQEMVDSFLRRFGAAKTFHLYGAAPSFLQERYRACPQIVFKGRHPQEAVFDALAGARVAVNYFPNHAPHTMQTPTKLLEYAALGCRILCNEHPRSRETATRHAIACQWGPAHDMFAELQDALDWRDNAAFDPAPLLWPRVIEDSGIGVFLRERSKA